jgi:hypothetical protein
MPHPTLIIPFALAPTEHAKDLLATLQAPSLAQLLSHASAARHDAFEPYAPLLPHEQWLIGSQQDNSPAIAHVLKHQLGLTIEPGYWFVLEPAHFHVTRDHLVLTDRRQLTLDDATSRTLFDAAHPLFEELGYTLRYGDAHHWLLRADAWSALRTCSPDAACGHNIDVWLPRGPGERDWRRLLPGCERHRLERGQGNRLCGSTGSVHDRHTPQGGRLRRGSHHARRQSGIGNSEGTARVRQLVLEESPGEFRVQQHAHRPAVLQAQPYADEIQRAAHHDGDRRATLHAERLKPSSNARSVNRGLVKGECCAFGGSHPKSIRLPRSMFCEGGRKRPTGWIGKTTEQGKILRLEKKTPRLKQAQP